MKLSINLIYTVLLPQAKDGRVTNISKGTNFPGWSTRSQPQACVAVQSGGEIYFQLMRKNLFKNYTFQTQFWEMLHLRFSVCVCGWFFMCCV